MTEKLLVVDDEPGIRASLKELLSTEGYQVLEAADGQDALDQICQNPFDLVIADIRMPKIDGIALLKKIKETNPFTEVIILTAYASVETAVRVLREDGAFDYLSKPLKNVEDILQSVRKALERKKLRINNQRLIKALRDKNRALRASKMRYRSLVETLPNAVQEIDIQGNITYANQAHCEKYGYDFETLTGKTVFDLQADEAARKELEAYLNHLVETQPEPTPWIGQDQTKNGRILNVQVDWQYNRDAQQNVVGFTSVISDITQRLKVEKERIDMVQKIEEAQRVEVVSKLAGGIAHQFNNKLSVVTFGLDLLEFDLSDHRFLQENFTDMKEACQAMSRLTRQLLAYARGGKYRLETVSVASFWEDYLPLLLHRIPSALSVVLSPPDPEGGFEADMTQIQLVLSSIIDNAVEALEDHGQIRISSRMETVAPSLSERPELPEGTFSVLRVEDDGKGIEPDLLPRVFDPFVTTKSVGRGMGLAAVHGIVGNHGGAVRIRSKPAKGTTVDIYLPHVPQPVDLKKEIARVPQLAQKNIMLIEDDLSLLHVSKAMLEKMGCHVLACENGAQAVAAMLKNADQIDLVLMDAVLPDVGPWELFQQVKKTAPRIPVIVCSGYSKDGPARQVMEAGAKAFLQKPYSHQELARIMQQWLP